MNSIITRTVSKFVFNKSQIQSVRFASNNRINITLQQKKGLTLFALLGFVGAIYYTAMNKMNDTDELTGLLEKEDLITNNKRK